MDHTAINGLATRAQGQTPSKNGGGPAAPFEALPDRTGPLAALTA